MGWQTLTMIWITIFVLHLLIPPPHHTLLATSPIFHLSFTFSFLFLISQYFPCQALIRIKILILWIQVVMHEEIINLCRCMYGLVEVIFEKKKKKRIIWMVLWWYFCIIPWSLHWMERNRYDTSNIFIIINPFLIKF